MIAVAALRGAHGWRGIGYRLGNWTAVAPTACAVESGKPPLPNAKMLHFVQHDTAVMALL